MLLVSGSLASAMVLLGFAARPHVNPPVVKERALESFVHTTPEAKSVLTRVCNNCHSHETEWPWYSRVPPASWLIEKDVEAGRKVLNFSEWPHEPGREMNRAAGLLMAACGAVSGDVMPPARYVKLHPEAKLSEKEKQQFCAWATTQATTLMVLNRRAKQAAEE